MTKLPSNISKFMSEYKHKMTGMIYFIKEVAQIQ